MGRPPIGDRAMTSTERSRRRRVGLAVKPAKATATKPAEPATKPSPVKDARIRAFDAELAQKFERYRESFKDGLEAIRQLKAENAVLKAELAKRRSEGQVTRGHRERAGERPVEFTEAGKLRAEIGRLKSDIAKLKMMLQEEPDAAKLRKKVVDQQVEMASLRRNIKQLVKERDEYRSKSERYAMAKHREARAQLTRKNHNTIIKALHVDRDKSLTAEEIAEARRVAIALRPLFGEG